MRLETTAGQLRAALRCMTGIVNRRNTIPVLGCVKFEAGRMIATDLDCEISVVLPATATQDAAVVDYFGLSAIAAHVDAGEILTIAEGDNKATIAFNGSEYRLPAAPVADFPDFARPDGERVLSGNMGLVAAMRRVAFAISTEETRYYLNGVALLNGPEGPVLAATDGHRAAILPLPSMPDGAHGAILPGFLVAYLAARKTEPVAVTFNTEKCRALFELPGCDVATKLIDGKYPDIFRVVPNGAVPVFSVPRLAALNALRRLMAVMRSQGRFDSVKFDGGKSLRMIADSGDFGATETVAWYGDGPEVPFVAGYGLRYLVEAFSRLTGDVVTFAAAEPLAGYPAVITSENDPLKLLLMPRRI